MTDKEDPRLDPDVIKVFWEMRGETEWRHSSKPIGFAWGGPATKVWRCSKCGKTASYSDMIEDRCTTPDPITMSLGDLAFWMRDKCNSDKNFDGTKTVDYNRALHSLWVRRYDGIRGRAGYDFLWWTRTMVTPEDMIRAACAAWRMK